MLVVSRGEFPGTKFFKGRALMTTIKFKNDAVFYDAVDIEDAERLLDLIDDNWGRILGSMDQDIVRSIHADFPRLTRHELLCKYLRRAHDGGIEIG